MSEQSLTTKEVAETLAVGVSTVKRWVDLGFVEATRTLGGHRRIGINELKRMASSGNFPEIDWNQLFGLRPSHSQSQSGDFAAELFEALQQEKNRQAYTILARARQNGFSMATIADSIIAPTMAQVRHLGYQSTFTIYKQRRATEILLGVLHELANQCDTPQEFNAPICVGGTPEGDHSHLTTLLISMVLREEGWRSVNLGPDIPFAALAHSLKEYNPSLVWLALGHVNNSIDSAPQLETFAQTGQDLEVATVIFGNDPEENMLEGTSKTFQCNRMEQLLKFARTIYQLSPKTKRGRVNYNWDFAKQR